MAQIKDLELTEVQRLSANGTLCVCLCMFGWFRLIGFPFQGSKTVKNGEKWSKHVKTGSAAPESRILRIFEIEQDGPGATKSMIYTRSETRQNRHSSETPGPSLVHICLERVV